MDCTDLHDSAVAWQLRIEIPVINRIGISGFEFQGSDLQLSLA
jgi:hypothetical protein